MSIIGTKPEQVPLNQFLGNLAFLDKLPNSLTTASAAASNNTLALRDSVGDIYATKFRGDGSLLTNLPSGGITISNDTSTNATRYVPFTSSTSGSVTTINSCSTKLYFNPSSGTLSATNFASLSDIEFKTNIEPINNALEIVRQLEGVTFDWKSDGSKSSGVIAQEVEKILPFAVNTNFDIETGLDTKTVNYNTLIAYLIEAIKELDKKLT